MNILFWTALALAVFLVQTLFSTVRVPLNVTVVLVALFGRAAAHHFTEREGFSGARAEFVAACFGLCIGGIEDLMSGVLLGSAMLGKGLVAYASARIFSDVLFRWTPVLGALTMMAFTLFDWLSLVCTRMVFGGAPVAAGPMIAAVVLQSIINGMFGMLLRPGRFRIA
ncbi:MAG TPA: hypothetical protein VK445_03240 [Dissulfurispiraceae bacterium]|nr:hypothetical protein [Dissulfurispiraceae bacterium]